MQEHNPDPVAMYMRELSTIAPLTKLEETNLFQQLRGTIGTDQREVAERRLIESQLPLVADIAEQHRRSGVRMLDLIEEGNLALIKSVRAFAERPVGDFSTFAEACIEDAITKAYPGSK